MYVKEDEKMSDTKRSLSMEELENVSGGRITEKQALDAALKHAGKKKGSVNLKKNKLEFDDGIYKYEVEFIENGYEYEFDIDADTGMILKFEKELCD